jgi:hypothetical protein
LNASGNAFRPPKSPKSKWKSKRETNRTNGRQSRNLRIMCETVNSKQFPLSEQESQIVADRSHSPDVSEPRMPIQSQNIRDWMLSGHSMGDRTDTGKTQNVKELREGNCFETQQNGNARLNPNIFKLSEFQENCLCGTQTSAEWRTNSRQGRSESRR